MSAPCSRLEGVVCLPRYPLEDPSSTQFLSLAQECRETFLRQGIVTLPGFLTEAALATTVREVEGAKSQAWFTDTSHNVFLDCGDPELPQDHVRNRQLATTVASLAYDRLDGQVLDSSLHCNRGLTEKYPIGYDIPNQEFQIPNMDKYFQLGIGDLFSDSALPD